MRRPAADSHGRVRELRRRRLRPGGADGKGRRLGRALRHGAHLAALGPSPLARARLVWAAAWLPARGASSPPLRLSVATHGRRFRMAVRDIGDLTALGEVMRDEVYDVSGLEDVREIVDLGSHVGSSTAFFHARYPGARIHSVEPHPGSYRMLEANVGRLPGVVLDRRAASGGEGDTTFFCARRAVASSLAGSAGPGIAVQVRTVGLDGLMASHGIARIDLLKLDVEGAEYDVLAKATRLRDVRAIAGELHPRLIPAGVDAFFALLEDYDVRVTRVNASSWQFRARRR